MPDLTLRAPGAIAEARAADDPYMAALAVWLEGLPPNTQRAYSGDLRGFFAFAAKHPRDVLPLDVSAWKEHLKARGLCDRTIARKLSALSSYYAELQTPLADGRPIHEHNPVSGVGRRDLDISPYESARKLSATDFRALLAAIDDTTVMGARDRAMFLFYVLCARRRREVTGLRGRDLRVDGPSGGLGSGRVMYRVRLKGGKTKMKEVPPPVWEAIKHYLTLAGRVLADDTPLFVATVDAGDHLRAHYGAPPPEGETPITGEAMEQSLRRYAQRAGLAAGAITLHSLRHLGAELFHKASGGDVRQTQLFLDHSHLNTTQIYLTQLTGEEHRHWQAMANELGV